MPDTLTAEQRSKVMSRNRPKGTKSTEWALRARLVAAGIRGWEMHAVEIEGKPDFVFHDAKLAIFVDGCFWHGCVEHKSIPATNREFWEQKIQANKLRDEEVSRKLKRNGWTVIRIWEHELKESSVSVLAKIKKILTEFKDS